MRILALLLAFVSSAVFAQAPKPAAPAAEDVSGMYNFLRDGEFVQLNVDASRVTGFISRYADAEKNPQNFIDQFFDKAALDGNKLSFTTKTVQGVHFDFKGTVERGPGKTRNDEGYFVLRGTLTQFVADPTGKTTAQARQVELKSFPADAQGDTSAPQ